MYILHRTSTVARLVSVSTAILMFLTLGGEPAPLFAILTPLPRPGYPAEPVTLDPARPALTPVVTVHVTARVFVSPRTPVIGFSSSWQFRVGFVVLFAINKLHYREFSLFSQSAVVLLGTRKSNIPSFSPIPAPAVFNFPGVTSVTYHGDGMC